MNKLLGTMSIGLASGPFVLKESPFPAGQVCRAFVLDFLLAIKNVAASPCAIKPADVRSAVAVLFEKFYSEFGPETDPDILDEGLTAAQQELLGICLSGRNHAFYHANVGVARWVSFEDETYDSTAILASLAAGATTTVHVRFRRPCEMRFLKKDERYARCPGATQMTTARLTVHRGSGFLVGNELAAADGVGSLVQPSELTLRWVPETVPGPDQYARPVKAAPNNLANLHQTFPAGQLVALVNTDSLGKATALGKVTLRTADGRKLVDAEELSDLVAAAYQDDAADQWDLNQVATAIFQPAPDSSLKDLPFADRFVFSQEQEYIAQPHNVALILPPTGRRALEHADAIHEPPAGTIAVKAAPATAPAAVAATAPLVFVPPAPAAALKGSLVGSEKQVDGTYRTAVGSGREAGVKANPAKGARLVAHLK